MTLSLPLIERPWLEQFFAGRNALQWDAIVGKAAPVAWLEQIEPWLAILASQSDGWGIVLPIFDVNGPCQWYGMATDDIAALTLAQELTAVVGPSYSDFCGDFVQTADDDPIEQALKTRFGRFVFRLSPVDSAARISIVQALQIYLGLLRRRPSIPNRTRRPFGRIRGEFDRALLAGHEKDAASLHEEMIGTGRLNVEQQKYLEIRMLAGLGRQRQLAHDYSLIRSVLDLSLPPQTIADVVEALYAIYIRPIEHNSDIGGTIASFREQIEKPFGPLFKERKGIRRPDVLKAFLLYELAQTQPNTTRCDAIVAAYPAEAPGRDVILRWNSHVHSLPLKSQNDGIESARKALGDEDYELALDLCFASLPNPFAYSGLLRCAKELAVEEITRRVLDVIATAPENILNSWNNRDLTRLAQLRKTQATAGVRIRPEADWLSWAEYVKSGNYDRPPLQILEEVAPGWSVEVYASDPQTCSNFASMIGNASGTAEKVFRDSFVIIAEFFVDRLQHPVRGFIPIYLMLIRAVAWNGAVSPNELEIATGLMQALIDAGPPKEDYTEALEAYEEILAANSAPGNIDWSLNAAEMLALHASPDKESRLRFFITVVQMASKHVHRLKTTQIALLKILAQDFGCLELLDNFPTVQVDNENAMEGGIARFAGLIGIYTLTETAALRARQFLRKTLPNARVEINADLVATDRLKHLAAAADVFVFAWKSSKHQAYYAAKEARGDREMLLPVGRGSASILESVLSELGRID
jgi:hypothetical protein